VQDSSESDFNTCIRIIEFRRVFDYRVYDYLKCIVLWYNMFC